MHVVATWGTIFNWASILASSLKTNITTTKHAEAEKPLEFYMASYLLDFVYIRCQFENWSYNWDTLVTSSVHTTIGFCGTQHIKV